MIDRLIRLVIGEAKTGAPSFRNLPVRLSIPRFCEGLIVVKVLRQRYARRAQKKSFFLLDSNFRNTF